MARRAHYGTSFDPEKRGDNIISDYENELRETVKSMDGATNDEIEGYIKCYRDGFKHWLSARGRLISPMIAGPAGMNYKQQEKYRDWEHSSYGKFRESIEKREKRIRRNIEFRKPREQKSAETWAKYEDIIREYIETIRAIDAGKAPYSRPLIVSGLVRKVAALHRNGDSVNLEKAQTMIREAGILRSNNKVFSLSVPVVNSGDTKNRPDTISSHSTGSIQVTHNADRNGIEISFTEKPTRETLDNLKGNGFRWSGRQKLWYAKASESVIQFVKNLVP